MAPSANIGPEASAVSRSVLIDPIVSDFIGQATTVVEGGGQLTWFGLKHDGELGAKNTNMNKQKYALVLESVCPKFQTESADYQGSRLWICVGKSSPGFPLGVEPVRQTLQKNTTS